MDFVQLMVELGFEIATFATTIGSHHPFIPKLEADAYRMRLTKKNPRPSEADIKEQMNIFNNWVFDEDDYLGAVTRTAFTTLPNATCIYASVVREIFDKKAKSKTLRFFYSGPPGHEVGSFGSKWNAIKNGSGSIKHFVPWKQQECPTSLCGKPTESALLTLNLLSKIC
jgi:hypothetical protein